MTTLQTFYFSVKSEGKGRNGYFYLDRATYSLSLTDPDNQVCHIDFLSKRSRAVGPARLQLTRSDLYILHSLLECAIRDIKRQTFG